MSAAFPAPVEAVLFDMDGLLLDSETVYRTALVQAADDFGHDLTPAIFEQMVGSPQLANEAVLRAQFGAALPVEAFWARARAHLEATAAAGIALKAGAIELLDRLEARRLPRALVTSSGRASVERHLTPHGVLRHFSAVVTGDDVIHGKPDPEPYLKGAAALGVAPERCLALEDSHNGVRAAHAAGMMTVMVPDILAPTPEMHAKCCLIARDLHQVRAALTG